MTLDHNSVRRILVIKLRAIGDVLLSTIVTKNLRHAFPQAQIDYLTEPPSVDVVRDNPHINGTMVFKKSETGGLELIMRVRRAQYDMIIDLFGNPRTALVTRLSGARYRIGYRFRGRTYAYNIVAEPRGGQVHNTQFNLDALEALGIAIQDRSLYFQFDNEEAAYVARFLDAAGLSNKVLVCLNTGGGWYTKRWRLEQFAALGDRLVEHYGAHVVLSWGRGQLEEVEKLQSLMRQPAFVPPETTLRQLGALLKRCSLVVTNDSGPMHIAAALGVPVVGIYGPTNPALQGPYGSGHVVVRNEKLDCLGCNLTKCPIGNPCMLDLTVDDVLRGVEDVIKKNNLML
ncbi:MAG: glycosyltransferase family 9 protein [Bacteroidetes bacterium]|nr:glycosyltransferase family 9 protein [Bacteroidota bacterium]MCW5897335.1 glycosyltransferase family 9 protein [Bacteroidota bacterium]